MWPFIVLVLIVNYLSSGVHSIELNRLKNPVDTGTQISNNQTVDSIKLYQLDKSERKNKGKSNQIDNKLMNQLSELNQVNSLFNKDPSQLNQISKLNDELRKQKLRIVSDPLSLEQQGSLEDDFFRMKDDVTSSVDEDSASEPKEERPTYNYSNPDLSTSNDDEFDEPSRVIKTKLCSIDRCRSANQTNPNYYLVDCKSENKDYKCFYCPKDHVYLKNRYKCIGPCKGNECDKFSVKNAHVYCPTDYEDDDSLSLCIKDANSNDHRTRPLSLSFFYVKNWHSMPLYSPNDRRKLVHQINLENFKDKNGENACEFEMSVPKLIDSNYKKDAIIFTMDKDSKSVKFFTTADSTFESATVTADCVYKGLVLHRTTLYFNS